MRGKTRPRRQSHHRFAEAILRASGRPMEVLERRQLLSGITIYVDQSATGQNTGADWADAYTNLQAALTAAQAANPSPSNPIAINVAQGTYFPGNARSSTFQLISDVALYGGFPSGGAATPNPVAYATILTGGGTNYHVVTGSGTNSTAVLDGFTVSGGEADGDNTFDSDGDGGGIYNDEGSPTVENCTITADITAGLGGGMFNISGSTPAVTNCTFVNDSAYNGGGIYDDSSSPVLAGCIIEGDSASNDGGGLYSSDSYSVVSDCIFEGDSAKYEAGAAANIGGAPVFTNCLIEGDSAYQSAAVLNSQTSAALINCTLTENIASDDFGSVIVEDEGSASVTNCILWGNTPNDDIGDVMGTTSVTYTDIGTGHAGEGNIIAEPQFVSPANPELQIGSQCIGTGNVAAVEAAGESTDLAGNSRIIDGTVDMGAYEFQPHLWYGLGDGVSWNSAANWASDQIPNASADVIIPTGTTVKLSPGSSQANSLTLQGNATLDLGSGTLLINYETNSDPIATLESYLAGGYSSGAWNGSGIISSTVASENASQKALVYSIGYSDGADGIVSGLSSGQIEITPTLAGDAKLQGNVTFGDFQLLAQYFGQSGGWDEGNFTYGSTVDFGDFQLLAQNFGSNDSALAAASTPAQSASPVTFASEPDFNAVILTGSADDTILGSAAPPVLNDV
jgi:hypothetical protein